MSYRAGYTLIELLIITTITGILVTFGTSAYSSAQKRQTVKAVSDALLTSLERTQKLSLVGDKDCSGEFTGYQVAYSSGGNTLTTTAICTGNSGANQVDTINNATFASSGTITFRPLGAGVNLGGATSRNLDFSVNNDSSTYRISVNESGTIHYVGKI